jgi:hypothetical protein
MPRGARGGFGGWPVRAVGLLLASAVLSGLASGCSGDKAATGAPSSEAHSEQVLKKDCTDQKWRDQNLGLWYSLCRQPLHW